MSTGSALIYCRVSTKRQEDEGTSLDSQEAACIAHAQSLGFTSWRVTREVYSGAELYDRPLLSRDRADLKSGQFQALIAYSTDRLSRDPIHLAILAEDCQRHGIPLIFVSEPLDTTPEGQLIQYVKGYSNKMEREKIRERQLRGKRQRALNGKVNNHGPELYGYRRDKTTGKRVIYEPEAAIIRDIYTLIVSDHRGATSVAKRLNQLGIPSASVGKMTLDRQPRWRHSQVSRLVRHPAFKGETYAWMFRRPATAQERLSEDYDKTRQRVIRPESEWIRLPDDVTPPIVSSDVWQRAQEVLSEVHSEATRNEQHPHLLRGFVYCGVCGLRMYSDRENNPPRAKAQIYRCSSRVRVGKPCGGGRIVARELEAWVWEQVSNALRHTEVLAAEMERRRAEGPDETLTADLDTARREFTKRDRKQAQLLQRFTASDDDSFPWELVEREIARLEGEKVKFLSAAEKIERRLVEQQHSVSQLENLTAYCARVAQNLDTFGFAEKRMAYEALAIRITGNGHDSTLVGSIPLDGVTDVTS
jgi:site-specific DNA recombinase